MSPSGCEPTEVPAGTRRPFLSHTPCDPVRISVCLPFHPSNLQTPVFPVVPVPSVA